MADSKKIIVGAAEFYVASDAIDFFTAADISAAGGSGAAGLRFVSAVSSSATSLPAATASASYSDTLDAFPANSAGVTIRNVGYTMNGLEVQFAPDFGEVQVDQLLDVARLYKQGMTVNIVTAFAESTLENLVVAIAAKDDDFTTSGSFNAELDVTAGEIGDVPLERALVAVGPGSGNPTLTGNNRIQRVYTAYRALSIDNVTASAKRDEPTMYEVSFRLLPAANGAYGKIIDRDYLDSGSVIA
jgi:hypothetical protein